MDNEMRELLVYRIKRAKELLEVAERLFEDVNIKILIIEVIMLLIMR